MARVAVLGLGNVLLGDDALGPYVIQTLQAEYEFAPDVTVMDAGTPGLDLIPYIMGAEALIVVDTVKAEGQPGELRLYQRETLMKKPPPSRLTPHEPGLKETLLTLELHGDAPQDVSLIGVIPEDTSTGIGLTDAVHSAVPKAVEAVLVELERLRMPARKRAASMQPDLWWERRGHD